MLFQKRHTNLNHQGALCGSASLPVKCIQRSHGSLTATCCTKSNNSKKYPMSMLVCRWATVQRRFLSVMS